MAIVTKIENLGPKDFLFRNFEGREMPNNAKGKRNFCVKLTDEKAEELRKSNHYVKMSDPDKDGNQYPFVKINVNMDATWPPEIDVFTAKGEVKYGEDELPALDKGTIIGAEIETNSWMKKGGDHYTLWLRSMKCAFKEDDRSEKYRKMAAGISADTDGFSYAGQDDFDDDEVF